MPLTDQNCVFCSLPRDNIVYAGQHWFAIVDQFPVTPLHHLLIPKNHRRDYFNLQESEIQELPKILTHLRKTILALDNNISGFNIGMNCGASAGQTIFHCHVHLIPRRDGDTANPQGGVRGVIPAKQSYSVP